MDKKGYPKFQSEAEEIAWLNKVGPGVDAHMRELSPDEQEAFRQRAAARPAGGEPPRKMVSFRMPVRDLARAKWLARELDMGYQTLMLELIQKGLEAREQELRALAHVERTAAQAAAEGRLKSVEVYLHEDPKDEATLARLEEVAGLPLSRRELEEALARELGPIKEAFKTILQQAQHHQEKPEHSK